MESKSGDSSKKKKKEKKRKGPVIEERDKRLPQKKFYRQRAHSNPISDHPFDVPVSPDEFDWSELYPSMVKGDPNSDLKVEILDVGCGYGGLLVELSPMFPQCLLLGLEIRVKVSEYVRERVKALREINPGSYNNIACLRTNAMKYLPNYFAKGQLQKMFFLYPDPHFKKAKHKWRIISDTLLAEYAYLLRVEGILYTATDVQDLHEWMVKCLDEFPLFQRIGEEELASDVVASKILDSTEEGKKVTRNKGDKWVAVYRRIADPYESISST